MRKLIVSMLLLLIVGMAYSQSVLHEKRSIYVTKRGSGKGVGFASVNVEYGIRKFSKNEIAISVSANRVEINAGEGYYLDGKKYGSEVPGLTDLLSRTSGNFPTIEFEVYYGSIKIASKTYSISSSGDFSLYTGDFFTVPVSESQLSSPNFSVKAVSLKTFNYKPDPMAWWAFENAINEYNKGLANKAKYDEFIRNGDVALNRKSYQEARSAYYQASQLMPEESYPKDQIKRVDELFQQEKADARLKEMLASAQKYEQSGDLMNALTAYENANEISGKADLANINRVKGKIEQQRLEQERKIKEAEEKQKAEQEAAKKELEEKEVAILAFNKEVEEQKLKEEEAAFAEAERALAAEEQRALQEERVRLREEAEERDRRRRDEEAAESRRKQRERVAKLDREISRAEEHMSYDPELFAKYSDEGDESYNLGIHLNPSAELEVQDEWWTHSSFMESIKLQLEEPKRQAAWSNYHQKLQEQSIHFYSAKYSYLAALKYVDRGSRQHKYLLNQIKFMDDMVDIQKDFAKMSIEQEQQRQANVQNEIAYRQIKRQQDNRATAQYVYSQRIQRQMYPEAGSQNQKNDNAIMNSYYFEQRLNQAQAISDAKNVVTGTVTQTMMDLAEGQSLNEYANNSWGIDAYLNGIGIFMTNVIGNVYDVNNTASDPLRSEITSTMFMSTGGGLDVWINKGRYWDLAVGGEVMLGWLPFAGYSDYYYKPSGILKVNAGIKEVKLAVEVHQGYLGGGINQDKDVAAANSEFGMTYATEEVIKGNFGYGYGRYGAGLHFNFSPTSYLRLLAYAEKPAFHKYWDIKKPPMTFEATAVFTDYKFTITYGDNYPVAGKAEKIMGMGGKGTYLNVQIICPIFTLFNSSSLD